MEINKKNRTELKSFFQANNIPTQQHFADFVEAGLNQAEDGIAKVQGNPLALQAEGEAVGTQEILNLFSNFAQDNPDWSLNLNPRVEPQAPESNQPGLNIKDVTGQSRLFIQSGDGNIGIGTIEPEARLTVQGTGNGSLIAAVADTVQHSRVFEVSQEAGSGMLSLRAGDTTEGIRLSGAVDASSFFLGNVGIGTATPSDTLTVYNGELALQTNNNAETQGLLFQNSGDNYTWRMYRKDAGGSAADLVFASGNDTDFTDLTDRITFRTNGNVGIGTESPSEKLHVNGGRIRLQGGSQTYLSVKETGSNAESRFWTHTDGELYIQNNNGIHFTGINAAPRYVSMLSNGNVGIGTQSPAAPLSISGSGKENTPDARMHLTNRSILFGGDNAGKAEHSAKIIATNNQLRIMGMASNNDLSTRKVNIFAEDGLTVQGQIKTPINYVVAFSVSLSINMTGAKNPLIFGHINYNHGNHFKSNNHFIAPVEGLYLFTMCMRNNTDNNVGWWLRLNDSGYVNGIGNEPTERSQLIAVAKLHMNSRTVITKLNAGDKVHVEQFGGGGNDNYSSGFEGILLQALT